MQLFQGGKVEAGCEQTLVLDLVRVQCHGLLSFNSLYELDVLDQTFAITFRHLSQQPIQPNLSKVHSLYTQIYGCHLNSSLQDSGKTWNEEKS